jgi:hypothetical protein
VADTARLDSTTWNLVQIKRTTNASPGMSYPRLLLSSTRAWSAGGYFLVGDILNVIESTSIRGFLFFRIVMLFREYKIYQT